MRGLLVHRAGGLGGSTWAFEWKGGSKDEQEEEGFRFGDHAFRVGEYVSVREEEGQLLTFRVVRRHPVFRARGEGWDEGWVMSRSSQSPRPSPQPSPR